MIPPASTRYFGDADYHVALDPRTHIVFDDARHYLLTTTEKFDIIASDPLDVFIKGTAALYSKEYFESVKKHLNPGGMFTLYVPLYETDEPTIKSELATFFEAFPYGTVWANTRDGLGYDMVFMGQLEPLKINLDEIAERANRPDYAADEAIASRDRHHHSLRSFRNVRRQRRRPCAVAQGRRAQHRRESAAQLSGGLGNQFQSGGRPIPQDAAISP